MGGGTIQKIQRWQECHRREQPASDAGEKKKETKERNPARGTRGHRTPGATIRQRRCRTQDPARRQS